MSFLRVDVTFLVSHKSNTQVSSASVLQGMIVLRRFWRRLRRQPKSPVQLGISLALSRT